ncbi:hypothetical protein [Ornithinibacillus contaminans]|uniref:hypothetical protein n=1 Tax=Ornithinibacillus contaminans TaxID=694055 RepID=UPI00064E0FFB|nr:hypothetical protein [Ornithinibacillus contaminans]
MNQKWTRSYTLLFVASFIGAGLLYGSLHVGLIRPLAMEESRLDQELAMYEKSATELEDIPNDKNDFAAPTIHQQIPTEKATASVVEQLEQVAKQSNVTITYMDARDLEKNNIQVQAASYFVEVDAAEGIAVTNFLEAILHNERFITVDMLDVRRSEVGVHAIITFTTYYTN